MPGIRLKAMPTVNRAVKVAVALLVFAAFNAVSGPQAEAKTPSYGRIELSTNPGGYPLLIDGKPSGMTTTTATVLDLSPGRHTVEVQMPNGSRWVHEFNIIAGRKNCIVLSYVPRPITVPKSPCPYPVNVSAPSNVNDGDTISFSSDVAYGGSSALNYTWTVSPAGAKILSGAGTPTITVDTTGLGHQRVTAILVVDDGSGERTCRQTAMAATNVLAPAPPPVQPRKFDEFPLLAFDDEKARLDNLAIELQNTPTAQGYIIVYAGRTSRPGQAQRLGDRTRGYLIHQRGIDPSRIMIVNGGVRDRDFFEVWIVPQGAQPPQPTPNASTGYTPPPSAPARRRSRRP